MLPVLCIIAGAGLSWAREVHLTGSHPVLEQTLDLAMPPNFPALNETSAGWHSTVRSAGGSWRLIQGWDDEAVAWGRFLDATQETGFARLEVRSNGKKEALDQAYGAGFVEGALSHKLIFFAVSI